MTTPPPAPDRPVRVSEPERLAAEPKLSVEPDYWDVCPNCGAAMQVVRCKYRCTRCTYFMSCSEF